MATGQTLSDIRTYWQRQLTGKNSSNLTAIRKQIIEHGDRVTLLAITETNVPPYLLGLTHKEVKLITTEAQQSFAPERYAERKAIYKDIRLLTARHASMKTKLRDAVRMLDNRDEALLASLG